MWPGCQSFYILIIGFGDSQSPPSKANYPQGRCANSGGWAESPTLQEHASGMISIVSFTVCYWVIGVKSSLTIHPLIGSSKVTIILCFY